MLTAGSTYALELEGSGDRFPAGAAYHGEVRYSASDAASLMVLTSAGGVDRGQITRHSATLITLTFPGHLTKGWKAGEVFVDLWRVDVADPMIWTATIAIPVVRPVTPRPASLSP